MGLVPQRTDELGPASAEWRPPCALHLYVPDVSATYEAALGAGATSCYAPEPKDYGDREAGVTDPHGNQWFIATRIEDRSEKEIAARVAAQD